MTFLADAIAFVSSFQMNNKRGTITTYIYIIFDYWHN